MYIILTRNLEERGVHGRTEINLWHRNNFLKFSTPCI